MRVHHIRRSGRLLLMPVPHLTATEIASFIDRTLSIDARERADIHLATCAECREELAACARIATGAPTPRVSRLSSWRWVGVAAAAGIVGIILTAPRWRGNQRIAEERAVVSAAAITPVSPSPGATLNPNFRFVWHDAGSVSYRLLVSDASGGLVWSRDVADTSVAPPTNMLKSGQHYFWHVEALLSDGRVLRSPLLAFTLSQ